MITSCHCVSPELPHSQGGLDVPRGRGFRRTESTDSTKFEVRSYVRFATVNLHPSLISPTTFSRGTRTLSYPWHVHVIYYCKLGRSCPSIDAIRQGILDTVDPDNPTGGTVQDHL